MVDGLADTVTIAGGTVSALHSVSLKISGGPGNDPENLVP